VELIDCDGFVEAITALSCRLLGTHVPLVDHPSAVVTVHLLLIAFV
jgi:hypothetical protein